MIHQINLPLDIDFFLEAIYMIHITASIAKINNYCSIMLLKDTVPHTQFSSDESWH